MTINSGGSGRGDGFIHSGPRGENQLFLTNYQQTPAFRTRRGEMDPADFEFDLGGIFYFLVSSQMSQELPGARGNALTKKLKAPFCPKHARKKSQTDLPGTPGNSEDSPFFIFLTNFVLHISV